MRWSGQRSRYADQAMERNSEKLSFESWHVSGIILYSKASRPLLESTQSHIRLIEGFLSSGLKRRGSEANDSTPSSPKVQNKDSYCSILPHADKAFPQAHVWL